MYQKSLEFHPITMKIFIILSSVIAFASSHAWIKSPVARTAIQKFESEFNTQPPYYYDFAGVWCSNMQQDLAYSTCGRCGEPLGNNFASQGGIYDKGVIVANWTRGSVVEIVTEIVAAHWGQLHLELCPQEVETDNCFQKLNIVQATEPIRVDQSICITKTQARHEIRARAQLPSQTTCNRCTLRMTYRTNYGDASIPGWEQCNVATTARQVFRNCADVAIH